MQLPEFRRHMTTAARVSAFAAVATAAAIWFSAIHHLDTAPKKFMGWAGKAAAREAYERLKGEFVPFRIWNADGRAPEDNTRKRVVLWEFDKKVNGGQHFKTFRQAIGDCVGAGSYQAMLRLIAAQIVSGERFEEFHDLFMPYHYACGRNAQEAGNGRMGRDPSGSTGTWQAVALKLYGVLPKTPDLPEYSERVAVEWATRMPDRKYTEIGQQHRIKSAALMRSADDVMDAVCNGYPVTIASDWGGLDHPPVKDGRLVNRRWGRWPHQMCVIGYDGSTGSQPYFYILNSWGPEYFGVPPDDSVPGGFWVSKQDIEYIVRQEDSYALSQFDGFPAQDWPLNVGANHDARKRPWDAELAEMRLPIRPAAERIQFRHFRAPFEPEEPLPPGVRIMAPPLLRHANVDPEAN